MNKKVPLSEALAHIGKLVFEGEYAVDHETWVSAVTGNIEAKRALWDLMDSVETYEHALFVGATDLIVTKRQIYDLCYGRRP